MRKSEVRKLLLFLLCAVSADAQRLPEQKVLMNQWITTWLLCGPIPLTDDVSDHSRGFYHLKGYEKDYLTASGGEKELNVRSGDRVSYPGGSVQWKLHSAADSVIDLRSAVSRNSPVLAYAYTELISDKDQTLFLVFGTNDGGTLWVNGKQVWDHTVQRSLRIDGDWVPVAFKKGKNRILFKIEQLGNRWEFCARLLPFSGEALSRRENVLRIDALKDGSVRMGSPYQEEVLNQLVRDVSVRVENTLGQTAWTDRRTGGFLAPVGLDSGEYQGYRAHFDITLSHGEKIHFDQDFKAGLKKEYSLFFNGKTDYCIALAPSASASEKWAAGELSHWLRQVSGADFPVVAFDQSRSPRIVIGYNKWAQQKTGMPEPAELDEACYYKNFDGDILIYGGRQRGSMYGVMSFLEKELGCRWYTPSVSVIPRRSEFKFSFLGHSEKPGIRVRNDFYYEAFDPVWAARNKMNGSMGVPDQPGGVESYWAVHTFYPLVPPEEFFASHPEYYSLLEGKRVPEKAQLCLSNPDVLKIVKDRIRKKMRESPEYLIYDVSQNDYYNPCECDKCQEIVKREGSESGLMIWFVNQVAESVEKEFPDKFIGTLAYQYTRSAPKNIKPRDNVVVRFCSIECCFSHDFKTCPQNQSFMTDLTEWSGKAPHLYIWDYVVNFSHYLMPYPNFAVLQPNIKTFQENKSIGIMEQAAYQGRGGEFAELRAYLISRLLWNPDIDTQSVIDDFMYGYYGRAGQFIRRYFDLLQGLVKPDTHIGLGLEPVDKLFTDKFIEESLAIFGEACKVADSEELVRRVDMATLPVLYLKCRRTPLKALHDGTYDKFVRITEREGITYFAESGKPAFDAFHEGVKNAR